MSRDSVKAWLCPHEALARTRANRTLRDSKPPLGLPIVLKELVCIMQFSAGIIACNVGVRTLDSQMRPVWH